MNRPKPVILIILDGFGIATPTRANAIAQAKTPNFDKYMSNYPVMPLAASGEAVGLSWGEMGNSEVGHLSLGSGTIYYQNLPKISKAISEGDFFSNKAFLEVIAHVKAKNSSLHILGLVSSGGVHSFNEHLYALVELAKSQKVEIIGLGAIATLAGRFYAMDRDNNWDRTELAYKAIVNGEAEIKNEDPMAIISQSYQQGVYDEQFKPSVVLDDLGKEKGQIKDNDGVIFFNFRADRARQLTKALIVPSFEKFACTYFKDLFFVSMTEYEKDLPAKVAFPTQELDMPLARVISEAGLKQLHLGETEKYAHVTYFFNGGNEKVYLGEDRVLVPSPHLSSYDQRPGMSAREVTNKVVQSIKEGTYDFMVVNFANADMVGHTGNFVATVEAIEILDRCVGEVVDTALSYNGVVLVTADHGNAESKYNLQTGIINKEHTNNPVPLFIVGQMYAGKSVLPGLAGTDLSQITPVGVLADVAPTILKIMGLKKPDTMTGGSLI